MDNLISKTEEFVEKHMSQHDCSHDFAHVQRVVRLARYIAQQEDGQKCCENTVSDAKDLEEAIKRVQQNVQPAKYDHGIVTLAALLHDVGDKKYISSSHEAPRPASDVLKANGASEALASTVQTIVENISYSTEVRNGGKDPRLLTALLARYPELGPVQDADRLDALGAAGIARCFAYRGALSERSAKAAKEKGDVIKDAQIEKESLDSTFRHFDEKLLKLEGMMKTETGRRLAKERTERLRIFRNWWTEEIILQRS